MNVYFLVEGRSSERRLYPQWLEYSAPQLTRVNRPQDATENNYFLISAEGYPSIIRNHLHNSIRDIGNNKNFNILVVVLDADEFSLQERIDEVQKAAAHSEVPLESVSLEIVVQNRCLETWLLGNRKLFTHQPHDTELYRYIQHYDVEQNDPEHMPLLNGFTSHGKFHYDYVKRIFQERNIRYTKKYPGQAAEQSYFD